MTTGSLLKAPTLIVMGVAGFVAWPMLLPEGKLAPPKDFNRPKAPARGPSARGPAPRRSPFEMARVEPAPGSSSPWAGPSTNATAKAGPTPGNKPSAIEPPSADDSAVVSMRLVGTLVDSHRPLAVIDGKVYAPGDRLRRPDGSTMPHRVASIRADRAVIRRGAREFVLAFSDAPRKAAPSPASTRGAVATGKGAAPAPSTAAKVVATARSTPPSANGPADRKASLMKLLSGLVGPSAAGSSGSMSGLLSESTSESLGVGLDALMGKFDDIGRGGPASPGPATGGGAP